MAGKNKAELWFGGLPTDGDIRRIRAEFPDKELEVGREITYEALAGVIGNPAESHRWKTVVGRWRRLVEKDSGIIVGVVRGQGMFRVLSSGETLDVASGKFRTAARSARRSFVLNSYVRREDLSADEAKRHDFLNARTAAVIAAAQVRGRAQLPTLA